MNALQEQPHLEYNNVTTMNTYNQLWIHCEHGFTAWIRGVVNTSIYSIFKLQNCLPKGLFQNHLLLIGRQAFQLYPPNLAGGRHTDHPGFQALNAVPSRPWDAYHPGTQPLWSPGQTILIWP